MATEFTVGSFVMIRLLLLQCHAPVFEQFCGGVAHAQPNMLVIAQAHLA